ncbi:MAG TPA: gluconokinase [Trueperaceae bacterium]|nr:gluconokinase [Trueperaceae bacterium]
MTQRDAQARGAVKRSTPARQGADRPSLAGPPAAVVIMGVSGSGKTSVGRSLASTLGYEFLDADDFHSEHNVAKMASGQPLTDGDRQPWLAAVRDAMAARLERGEGVVMACSALRAGYRDVLRQAGDGVRFVYLKAGRGLIAKRLARRSRHFFAPSLLDSQFATLEEPDLERECDVRVVDATVPRRRMPTVIIKALNRPK